MSLDYLKETNGGSGQQQDKAQKGGRQKFLAAISGKALRARLSGKVNRSLSTSEKRKFKEAYQNARSINKYKKLKKNLIEEGSLKASTFDNNEREQSTAGGVGLEKFPGQNQRIQVPNGDRRVGKGETSLPWTRLESETSLENADERNSSEKQDKTLSREQLEVDEDASGLQESGRQRKRKPANFFNEKDEQSRKLTDVGESEQRGKYKRLKQMEDSEPLLQDGQAKASRPNQEGGEKILEERFYKKGMKPVSQMEKLRQEAEERKAAIQAAKEAKEKEIEQRKKVKEVAEKKRKAISTKLRKVTSRGQPVMKHRMEMLLETIQKNMLAP